MITIADFSKTGYDHFLFNTGYFTILKRIFPEEAVAHYSHPSHFRYIREAIDTRNLQHHPVYIIRTRHKWLFPFLWLYKNLFDFFLVFLILLRSARQGGKLIFIAMMPVRSMWYLLFWHRFFPAQQVVLTFHGEIETWFAPHKSMAQRFHTLIFRKLFAYRNKHLKFFVPNDFIRQNLRKEPLFQQKDILAVYHLLEPAMAAKTLQDQPVLLSHIGSTEPRKNSGMFFELANYMQAHYPQLQFRIAFRVAGKYNPVFDDLFQRDVVQLADQQRIYERDFFDAEILQAHFSVVIIRPDEYIYRESGTVLESLRFHKPLIGLRHPYLDFLEARFGRIGIYGHSIEELATSVAGLFANLDQGSAMYAEMVGNIAAMHAAITLPALSNELRQQMQEAGMQL